MCRVLPILTRDGFSGAGRVLPLGLLRSGVGLMPYVYILLDSLTHTHQGEQSCIE